MIARFLALFSLVGYVAAQAAATPSGVPACLVSCSQASCPTNDLTCLCVTNIAAITECVLANCSAADQATAGTLAAQECAGLASASGSAVASATSAVESAVSSVASEVASAATSISSAIESAISSAMASGSSAAAGASASASGSAAGSAAAGSSTATAKSDADTLNLKAGAAFLGLAGVLIGFFAL